MVLRTTSGSAALNGNRTKRYGFAVFGTAVAIPSDFGCDTSAAQTRAVVICRISQTTGIPRLTTDLISAKATKATTPTAINVTTILTVKTCSMLIAACRACL